MKSPFTNCALAIPTLIGAGGIFYSIFISSSGQYDVTGAGIILKAGLSLLVASLLSIWLTLEAYGRKEPKAPTALILAVPGGCYILLIAYFIITGAVF